MLPSFTEPLPFEEDLRQRLDFALRMTTLNSEMARREMLIAPILVAVCSYADEKIKIEYRLEVMSSQRAFLDVLGRFVRHLHRPGEAALRVREDDGNADAGCQRCLGR